MPLPFTKYADMHSGYRDPDGARMEAFLRCWKEQTLRWAEKNGKQKEAAALAGRYQTQDALDALPPSAQNFWRAAAKVDWFGIYELEYFGDKSWERRLWQPSHIKPLSEYDPEGYKMFIAEGLHSPDSEYYQYHKNSIQGQRTSDFKQMLVYGYDFNTFYYGIVHGESSLDGEYQSITIGHGDMERFKSFAHLLANFYMQDYQQAYGHGTTRGHLYYFGGDWNKTCVPLLFDADEIASWRG